MELTPYRRGRGRNNIQTSYCKSVKAIRIDPGMFSGVFPSADAAVQGVVDDLVRWKADTAFVFAYSPIYGAYYSTSYPGAWGTSFLAAQNFLPKFVTAAKAKNIKVVASYRMNHYQGAPGADFHPEWRMLAQGNGSLPRPTYSWNGYGVPINPLSAYAKGVGGKGFADWFQGLLEDAKTRHPGLFGLEACEGNVAESFEEGATMPDFHPDALADFSSKNPGKPFGGPEWRKHRAAGLTELHRRLKAVCGTTHKAFVIHDLPCAAAQTTLRDPDGYAAGCGFDWRAIAALGFDGLILSAIWQQRQQDACEDGGDPSKFNPAWTGAAAAQFKALFPSANRYIHVEATRFPSFHQNKCPATPKPDELYDAIVQGLKNSSGVTLYSYDQLRRKNAAGKFVDNGYAVAVQEAFATA